MATKNINIDIKEPIQLVFTNPQDVEIGPKDIIELPTVEPIVIPGYEDNGIKPDLTIEIPMVIPTNEIVELTIYNKYDYIVKQYEETGDASGLITYAIGMEILRHCERQLNQNIPLNMSCSTCVNDLFKLFIGLK